MLSFPKDALLFGNRQQYYWAKLEGDENRHRDIQPESLQKGATNLWKKSKLPFDSTQKWEMWNNNSPGIGAAAAAAAIFAPLSYKWKGVLTAIATESILTGIYHISPIQRYIPG